MLDCGERRLKLFARLRELQDLYCAGKFAWGSPEHSEILALEALESLFVQQEAKRICRVELSLPARAGQDEEKQQPIFPPHRALN